jgi:hypothetical protein
VVRDLEQRFDGPVPEQYTATEQADVRRRRGLLAVYERQAAQYIDAALRIDAAQRADAELTELMTDDPQRLQQRIAKRQADRCRHLADAAEALKAAAEIRGELRMVLPLMLTAADLVRDS